MNRLVNALEQRVKHFLIAVQFFTRIPVTGSLAAWVGFDTFMLTRALAYFPLVGGCIGLMVGAILVLCQAILPAIPAGPWVAATASTVVGVLLTGAFHEDGLTDLVDGLGGSAHRDRAIEIMKDSRIGTFGASALFFALFVKIVLLTALLQINVMQSGLLMFAAQVASRCTPVLTVRLLPSIGDPSSSKSGAVVAGNGVLLGATMTTILTLVALSAFARSGVYLAASAGAVGGFVVIYRLINRRLGGFNGDALGAVQQCSELGFYFFALLYLGRFPP